MLRKETCFFLRRLSGLLSGYLPTDTRPQARAKLGKSPNKLFDPGVKRFLAARANFLIVVARSCQNPAAELLIKQSGQPAAALIGSYKRFDPHRVANERRHDRDASEEEQSRQHIFAVIAQPEQVRQGPSVRAAGQLGCAYLCELTVRK